MAEAEFWKHRDDGDSDLGDQIHGVRLEVEKSRTKMTDQIGGVRLEVEKVRTEMATTETKLVEKIGGVESRLVQKIGGVESRLSQRMTKLETRLSDRMDGLERSLRGWLVIGVSLIGAMIALLGLFG